MSNRDQSVREILDRIYTKESRKILATLIRLLGDFDVAEDALHDAFTIAVEQWQERGIPENPRSWLISTGRFKAIDNLRRRSRYDFSLGKLANKIDADSKNLEDKIDKEIEDDELRLIFTCCHPALSPEARVALTLREVCSLTTEEIASAFLISPSTLAQRIVRAKSKIRDAKIPFEMPTLLELPERIGAVNHVIYLVFNEGYSASYGETLTRPDLSGEAIRLGRLMLELLPEPEVKGLLSLMLLHESRRSARTSESGDLILLEDQDRTLWNQDQIREGISLVEESLKSHQFGTYTLQAAIAAVHSEASKPELTDWLQITALYDKLLELEPSPIIELNRAAAIAMSDSPNAGVELINKIFSDGKLVDYYLAYSARGELYRRLGNNSKAKADFEKALSLTNQTTVRKFLESRLQELQ
jgi:RNA polymerase sigma-70 factor, ECF subfamily